MKVIIMKEILITKMNKGQRADKFLRKYLSDAPLSYIYKLFRIKDVKINNKPVKQSYILQEGDILKVYITDEQLEEFSKPRTIVKSSTKLNIIYEDDNILLVNKPRGLLVHGDEKEKRITLTNIVLNYLCEKGEYNPQDHIGFTPAPCHRLDRNTSGIVVYAKNLPSLQELEVLFKEKSQLKKEYLALVVGKIINDGKIDAPLYKDENRQLVQVRSIEKGGKNALTYYHVIKNFKNCSLVNANIVTGRTHQIRVHFAYINHPVVGDSKYGSFDVNRRLEKLYAFKGQFLHSYRLTFLDINGYLSYLSNRQFECDLDKKEKKIIDILMEHSDAI